MLDKIDGRGKDLTRLRKMNSKTLIIDGVLGEYPVADEDHGFVTGVLAPEWLPEHGQSVDVALQFAKQFHTGLAKGYITAFRGMLICVASTRVGLSSCIALSILCMSGLAYGKLSSPVHSTKNGL